MSPNHLKIAIIAPPWLPVPPERYGGVEWVVSLLADRLAELGHDVTLYACGGSITQAKLVTTSEDATSRSSGSCYRNSNTPCFRFVMRRGSTSSPTTPGWPRRPWPTS